MKYIPILLAAILLVSCNKNKNKYDASGTFETEETIISAEASGVIKIFTVEEGQELHIGQQVGYIDSTQLYLRKKQLQAQVGAVLSRKPNISSQLASLEVQLKAAERDRKRIQNLVEADAMPAKQLDDANDRVDVIKKQIEAQKSTLGIASSSINEEALPVEVQIEQLNDQLEKCRIINGVNGTVLTKYAEVNEVTMIGKPLYKIADLSSLILKAYVTGDQFAGIKLLQHVKVLVDDGAGGSKEYDGVIEWICDKAEFTPKTIQTKDERANLVYGIKIRVKNDGLLKIGMYADVIL
jgi:HlyD family secretion protein